jgi:hypothetical protein
VCFSSDIHGNVEHLRLVLREAERRECDVVILGGDLAPRGNGHGFHELGALRDYLPHLPNGKPDWASDRALEYMQEGYDRQGEWFTDVLLPELFACPVPSVSLFGNSDWAGLMPRCVAGASASDGHVRFVDGEGDVFTIRSRRDPRRHDAAFASCDVFACSLVPICAHKKKDWERCDTRDVTTTETRAPFMDPEGFGSAPDGSGATRVTVPVTSEEANLRSIESSLERLLGATSRPPPLWVIHAPPRDTVADLCAGGDHVGSIAIRDAIRRWTPRASLHGHIHESVSLHGGRFAEWVEGEDGAGRKTLVCSSGNDFKKPRPFCLVLDTDAPERVERVECGG